MSGLTNVGVLFVRREQNCEAHNIACLGLAPSVSSFYGFADEYAAVCNHDDNVSTIV
jgi:hypothetical protein